MRFTTRSIATTQTSYRQMAGRASLIALICASALMVYLERQDHAKLHLLRAKLMDGLLPVVAFMNQPLEGMQQANMALKQWMAVHRENNELRLENARLRQWQATALQLESDNKSLRELMHYMPNSTQHFISAKVVGGAELSKANRIHINAGAAQGVERYQAVMNAYGLIGRVMNVSDHHAEVMLLRDANSRIPVRLEPSGVKAILSGAQQAQPRIEFTLHNQALTPGDKVMTAEDGGMLPAGILIGTITNEAQVELATQDQPLQHVRVVALTR